MYCLIQDYTGKLLVVGPPTADHIARGAKLTRRYTMLVLYKTEEAAMADFKAMSQS